MQHTHEEMADELIDVLLDGLRPRDNVTVTGKAASLGDTEARELHPAG